MESSLFVAITGTSAGLGRSHMPRCRRRRHLEEPHPLSLNGRCGDPDSLASQLQVEGAASFVKSWTGLMSCIEAKGEMLKAA